MTKEEYKKLNYYLNISCNALSYEDDFLLQNSDLIDFSCDEIMEYAENIDIDISSRTNNLTFMDVFLLTREIIETIDPKYLDDYDKLLNSGELDFSYNNEYFDSSFVYDALKKRGYININREFSYKDVVTLIHEYFHYTNSKTNINNKNRYLLTEFISIYFETYAINYLKSKGINREEIDAHFRIKNLKQHIISYKKYSSILTMFSMFGNIDETSKELMNNYFYEIDDNEFEFDCKSLLEQFQNIEKSYLMQIKYERYFNHDELSYRLSEIFKNNYRYILGTLLAFYAIKQCDIKNIIYLNDNINSYELSNLNCIDLLKTIGIDINDEYFIERVYSSIYEFVGSGKHR